jgi:hypothetical protein
MRCVLLHPERVRAPVPIATQTGTDEPATLVGYRALLEAWVGGDLPDEIAATIEHIPFGTTGRLRLRGTQNDAARARQISAAPSQRSPSATTSARGSLRSAFIHGDADAAIPLAKAEPMKAAIPGAERVVVAGDHSVNMINLGPST